MVAITYDTPELQQAFIDAVPVTYPFLSDIDASTMQALGILNEEYPPGDDNYGLPYPGIYVLDPEQKIVGKIFVERYQMRVDAPTTLAYAKELLGAE
jgi:peroxiredoxin